MNNVNEMIEYTKCLKLLYVEDNIDAREATVLILNEFFDDIIIAVDGLDGIEKFTNNDIDIIITDINMPRMNGLDMTKEIRKIDNRIPILVLSAYNESGFFIDSIKLGIEGYLLKPIDFDQFLESLNKVVQKLKVMSELYLLQQYYDVTDITNIVSKTDTAGIITYVNNAFCEKMEFTSDELIGKNHNIVRNPDTPSIVYEKLWDSIKNQKKVWQGVLKSRTKNGKNLYLESTIKPILNADGEIVEYISIKNDITEIMDQRKRLTGLVNSSNQIILVLFEIESFEDIQKYYGESFSQKIDARFADVLLTFMPEEFKNEHVYILGGGSYAIAKDMSTLNISMDTLQNAFRVSIQEVSDAVIELEDIEYDVSIIVSLAFGSNTYENALYGLKKLKDTKQDFIIANNILDKEKRDAENSLKVLKMVKTALENSNIITYYQPIIDNKTEEIAKYETLVRLIDEDDKVVSPYFFLDISKKGKYYSRITNVVLEQAFDMLKKIDKDISINISALDIEKKLIREKIIYLLQENPDMNHRIIFELLEDEEMKDFDVIKDFIHTVKSYGVQIAIDDFGAGYSNFERLLDYQPDILKIDACLIKNIVDDAYSLNVVETIVSFAKKQNIKTVGEYVENKDIYEMLKKLGIDYSQGYYFGKPGVLD
jgi:PAS domain S-box-containing protein